MEKRKNSTGKILLKREKKNFLASFCVFNQELPYLLKNISFLHPNEKNYYNTLKYDRRKSSYLLGQSYILEFKLKAVALGNAHCSIITAALELDTSAQNI